MKTEKQLEGIVVRVGNDQYQNELCKEVRSGTCLKVE